MTTPSSKPPAVRKRNRKRKRRVASSSSESSSDSDSSSSSVPGLLTTAAKSHISSSPQADTVDSSDEEEDLLSSSGDSSDSDAEIRDVGQDAQAILASPEKDAQMRSPSPDPPLPGSIPIPPFLPNTGNVEEDKKIEQELKEKFRKFWMTTIVDAFADDLDELRKEQNMNPSRLALLIDSLASGAEVFSSTSQPGTDDVNEVEVVLDGAQSK